jgi:transcription-repair coupling factor (superfamily II helicase)
LLSLAALRIDAHRWQIHSIHLEDGFAVLGYASKSKIEALNQQRHGVLRIADDQSAYLPLSTEINDSSAIMNRLKSLLQAE